LLSIPDAIAWVLEKNYLKDRPVHMNGSNGLNGDRRCPDCGEVLVFQEGCHTCQSCGFTQCG
jgi:ribonucleoside-diphosphate reductase alpha chain